MKNSTLKLAVALFLFTGSMAMADSPAAAGFNGSYILQMNQSKECVSDLSISNDQDSINIRTTDGEIAQDANLGFDEFWMVDFDGDRPTDATLTLTEKSQKTCDGFIDCGISNAFFGSNDNTEVKVSDDKLDYQDDRTDSGIRVTSRVALAKSDGGLDLKISRKIHGSDGISIRMSCNYRKASSAKLPPLTADRGS